MYIYERLRLFRQTMELRNSATRKIAQQIVFLSVISFYKVLFDTLFFFLLNWQFLNLFGGPIDYIGTNFMQILPLITSTVFGKI